MRSVMIEPWREIGAISARPTQRIRAGVLAAALLPALPGMPAFAQDSVPTAEMSAERRAELEAVTADIALTRERQDALKREIDALDKDRATLNQTLIETGQRVRALEEKMAATTARLDALLDREAAIRDSLAARRDVLAEVLGALQRLGRSPPPAIFVRAEDALASVRSAMLLGAVVPGLREQADALAADLGKLIALKTPIEEERSKLRADAASLEEEEERVRLLIEEKKSAQVASAAALEAEQKRAAELAEQATSLKDLIARMEAEIEAAAKAAAAARAAELGRNADRPAISDSDRIAPAIAFASARGLLSLPASGPVVRAFNEDDGLGGRTQGISIATRPSAQVTAPADGWVVFAGPFRSYGQVLIINASDGYHMLLAGMERIDVELGQFVLAGEPVALMGDRRLASAGAVDIGASQPMLYVEFRKDGTSIDPSPWWARPSDQKVGG